MRRAWLYFESAASECRARNVCGEVASEWGTIFSPVAAEVGTRVDQGHGFFQLVGTEF